MTIDIYVVSCYFACSVTQLPHSCSGSCHTASCMWTLFAGWYLWSHRQWQVFPDLGLVPFAGHQLWKDSHRQRGHTSITPHTTTYTTSYHTTRSCTV